MHDCKAEALRPLHYTHDPPGWTLSLSLCPKPILQLAGHHQVTRPILQLLAESSPKRVTLQHVVPCKVIGKAYSKT